MTNEKKLLDYIKKIQKEKASLVISIDGKSGAGKTTLASLIAKNMPTNIIHMDDFFLLQDLRSKKRLQEPGGNVHYERFKKEVIEHLKDKRFTYQKYSCKENKYVSNITIKQKHILIIEGSYALHPYFGKYYDLAIFLDVDDLEQKKRIIQRNGLDNANTFFKRWIPLENAYFLAFAISKKADLVMKNF